jgi:hypothetical protein
MKVSILKECGYDEAVLGFSLSYNSTLERTKEILPSYAHGIPGENKFLESMVVWLDIAAPRFWWQEFDTYRVGVTKQSESTMHTLVKNQLAQDNFEWIIPDYFLEYLNYLITEYKTSKNKLDVLQELKSSLPEGFLQRRIVCTNYKTLQNMYNQRKTHRLVQWEKFFYALDTNLEHPEFIFGEDLDYGTN